MVLLTAFEPFNGAPINASQEAASLLAQADPTIHVVVLPVVRGEAERIALAALQRFLNAGTPPALMLSLGEARRSEVSLEKVAINWDHFRISDNAGNQPRDEPIVSGGPDAYFATLPLVPIADALKDKTPLPVGISLSAGAFLCNHVAYHVLHAFRGHPPFPYAFVHVPATRPGDEITVEAIAETLRAVIRAIVLPERIPEETALLLAKTGA